MKSTGYVEYNGKSSNVAVGYSLDIQPQSKEITWTNNLEKHVRQGGPAGGAASTAEDLFKFSQSYLQIVKNSDLQAPKFPKDDYPQLTECVHHEGCFEGASSNLSMFPSTGDVYIVMSNHDNGRGSFRSAIDRKFFDLLRRT